MYDYVDARDTRSFYITNTFVDSNSYIHREVLVFTTNYSRLFIIIE